MEIEKEVDFLEEKYVELEKSNREMKEDSKKQENRVKDLMQKNTYLEKYNKALEQRIMRLEQKEMEMKIELLNVQKQEGEELMTIVGKLAQELKLNIEDIEKAWRIPGDKKEPRPVVVTLRSRDARAEWLRCRKMVVTNDTLYQDGNNSRIYINEHVTRQTRQLFWSAKNRLRETYKFIWIKDGKVLVKKNENEKKVYQINFENDIDTLIEKKEGN